ncbi:MAG: class I SAM-dependent methyltransferase [Bacteroidetes bacterium]|nr:class I SAM-dependent methyltransferase [Bacteroidota bacterium]
MFTIEKLFDMTANSYERTEEVRFKKAGIEILENTKRYLKHSDILLDFGCATGTKAFELAGSVKEIFAIDISTKMIELANKRAKDSGTSGITFKRIDIFDEELKENSFDIITAFNIMHLLEDNRNTVKRIAGLLKSGGLFISSTPCLGEDMKFSTRLQWSFFRLLMSIKLFPRIKMFKFRELLDLISKEIYETIEIKKVFHEMSGLFIAARKR